MEVRTHEPSAPAEAARHREGCARSVPAMCHAAALDAYNAPSSPETDEAAFDLFTRGCALGYAPSCNGVGVLYAQGRGTAKDPAHAAQIYREACTAGGETACQHLAEALRRGVGVSKDEAAGVRADARAKCLFDTSLKDGDAGACPAL